MRLGWMLVGAVFASAVVTGACATEISLGSLVNSDLNSFSDGALYPQAGVSPFLTVGGTQFTLSPIPPVTGTDTGVILEPLGDVNIPINEIGVTQVDTLINSAFGACGTNVGSLVFNFTSGPVTETLTEGTNIRDHFFNTFCNTAGSGINATATFGTGTQFNTVRLDEQVWTFAPGLGELTSIDFIGDGASGEPFLAALDANGTPVATPEPLTLSLFGAGLVGAAAMRRRKVRR